MNKIAKKTLYLPLVTQKKLYLTTNNMFYTKNNLAPDSLIGGGAMHYESPSCGVLLINCSGPLCGSLTDDSDPLPSLSGEEWPGAV